MKQKSSRLDVASRLHSLPEKWILLFYVVVSSLVFSYFYSRPQMIIYDSGQYWNLSEMVRANNFNVFVLDFEMRTYFHPLYLAVVKLIADMLTLSQPNFVYIANFILLLAANFFIYWRVKNVSPSAARAFLILSSVNIITLSFANTFLTEITAIFLTALIFFFLAAEKLKWWHFFGVGLSGGVFMYTRPSALIILICAALFLVVRMLVMKKYHGILFFMLGVILPVSVGMINTYNIDKKIALFTTRTSGIYDMQVRQGPVWVKYETSIDERYEFPTMYYFHDKNSVINEIPCAGAAQCFITYMTKKPLEYILSLALHVFNIFDRVYLDTYIQQINGRLPWLAFCNYVVLTGAMVGIVLFTLPKKWRLMMMTMALVGVGTLAIYVPTVVEPRFSAPVFPFMLVVFCYYLEMMYSEKRLDYKLRVLFMQVILVVLFFLISDLVDALLKNGPNRVY